jgi:hypothetical protein
MEPPWFNGGEGTTVVLFRRKAMARNDPQVIVRLPVELKDWVKAQSQKNHRSQNSEIVHILKSVQTSMKEAA